MTSHYDEMRVAPDPSRAEELRQRLHSRLASGHRDDNEPVVPIQDVHDSSPSGDTDRDDREGDIIMLDTEDRPTEPVTPRRRSPGQWLLAAAAVAVIAVVGTVLVVAGGDDKEDVDAVTPGPADDSTVDTAADQRIADEAVLVASDLPAGWTAVADAGLDNMENTMDECGAEGSSSVADDGDPRSVGNWEAPSTGYGFAGSNVEINPKTSQAEATLAALRTPAGQECLAASLAASWADIGVEVVGDIKIVEQDSEGKGDDAVAYLATVPLAGDGASGVIWNTDLISVRKGRALVSLTFGNPVTPMPDAEVQRLTDVVLDRIPADL